MRNLEAATKSSQSFNEKEREFINVIKMYKTNWDAHKSKDFLKQT